MTRILGTEAGHCKSIPCGDTDLATERRRELANPFHERLIAGHDQRHADRDTALGDRRTCQFATDLAVEPDVFSKNDLAAAAQSPAIDKFARLNSFAHRKPPEHHDLAEQK